MKLAITFLAACTGLAATCAGAETTIPRPKPRPSLQDRASVAAMIPIPRLRPDRSPAVTVPPSQDDSVPPSRNKGTAWPSGEGGWPLATIGLARARCAALIANLDVTYEPLAPLGAEGGCGAPAPISVTRVAGVTVAPAATLTCDMAAELHGWITDTVQPAARKRLNTTVTTIHAAASYVCRLRNNASTGKLSEHGRANALDMSGFSFAKSDEVTVKGGSWGGGILSSLGLSKSGSFLGDIRQGACGHFTTVLGPGSDPYHGDHFHVDVLQRKGGYRICK